MNDNALLIELSLPRDVSRMKDPESLVRETIDPLVRMVDERLIGDYEAWAVTTGDQSRSSFLLLKGTSAQINALVSAPVWGQFRGLLTETYERVCVNRSATFVRLLNLSKEAA
jgi:hypothetical protein